MVKGHQKIELKAQKRDVVGRKVKSIRASGYLPAVLYGKGQESTPVQIGMKDFEKVLKVAGESTLVYLNVEGGQSVPTIIHDVTKDPVRDTYLHADFHKVSLTEKIKANVPVVFAGESTAVKDLKGIFVRNVNELEVEAFPQDLPHEITIDISALKAFGDQILVKDIDLGDKIKVVAEPEEIVATVQEPISEEELQAQLAEPTTDVSAVEQIEKEKKEEEAATEEEATPAPAEEK